MYLQGIASFLDDLIGGLLAVSLSLVIGSLVWAFAVLRAGRETPDRMLLDACMRLLQAGAVAMAVLQALKLAAKAAVLASLLGELPWTAYMTTVQFGAGVLRILCAAALAWSAGRLMIRSSRNHWIAVVFLSLMLWLIGAWLTHAVGRFEHHHTLMAVTLLHQAAATAWVGGVIQLLVLRRMRHRHPPADAFWPVAISRFSATGMISVAVLITTGTVLALEYVGSWEGLPGTAYGSLLLVKILLLTMILALARLNFRAGRAWLGNRPHSGINTHVPAYIEAEAFLLIGTLFVAATVSSQPPAIDIPHLTASAREVFEMFRPRLPHLVSPTHEALLAGESGRLAIVDRIPSPAATAWSDYNHNVAGLFLLVMGLFALLSYVRGFDRARYWPAGFIMLSIFLFFRSDAETWPLGPIGFWESTFGNGEVLQHRIATLLALALGVFETRARRPLAPLRLRYVFPVLTAFGGVLLVTHAHAAFEIKSDFLIQSTHVAMGLLAMVMAAGRWLELRLAGVDDARARWAGLAAVTAMLLVSAVLIVYREPLY